MKVSTVIAINVLRSSYPPSVGTFSDAAAQVSSKIVPLLERQGAPLVLNMYSYFMYVSDPKKISLKYALFTSKDVVVRDGNLEYYNLFDAMVDLVFAALEKINASDLSIAILETECPSIWNLPYTSTNNAKTYNRNFMDYISNRTGMSRRPRVAMKAFLF
ncbi:hypothetical protein NL676_027690 [Syzygium grande]|nr:hypothetical protein NL676_027690 [Syzygium grande]